MPPYLKAEMGKKDRLHHGNLKFYQYKLNIRSKWEQKQVKVHEPQESEISLPFITIFSIQLPKKKRVVALPFRKKKTHVYCYYSLSLIFRKVSLGSDTCHIVNMSWYRSMQIMYIFQRKIHPIVKNCFKQLILPLIGFVIFRVKVMVRQGLLK